MNDECTPETRREQVDRNGLSNSTITDGRTRRKRPRGRAKSGCIFATTKIIHAYVPKQNLAMTIS